MDFWRIFNKVGKQLPDSKEIAKVPYHIKDTALNANLNKIDIRYFSHQFSECIETVGEIQRLTSISIVTFNVPDVKGAIFLINDFTYINRSRDNKLTIDVCANYPFGIDKNSSLIKFKNVKYQNIDSDMRNQFLTPSQQLYYKDYKFFVPVMLNQIPIPIVALDDADRLHKIDKQQTKLLANISQTFLREWIDIQLLKRTGSKQTTGFVYVAVLFGAIGTIFGLVLSGFIG